MAEKEIEARPVRWDPFRELGLWEPFGRRGARLGHLLDTTFGETAGRALVTAPPVDVTESDDEYVITAEVPGVKRGDLTLEIQEGVLSIRGEKKSEREEKKEKGRLLERTYGAFSRSFSLPADADVDGAKAKFEDGVLRLTLPKRPEAKPKSIAIKG